MMRTTPDAPIVVSGGSDPRAFFFFFSFQLKPSVDLIKRKNKKTIVELTSRRHTLEERGGKQVEEQKSSRRIRRTTRRKPRDHQELNEPQQQQRQPRFWWFFDYSLFPLLQWGSGRRFDDCSEWITKSTRLLNSALLLFSFRRSSTCFFFRCLLLYQSIRPC